MIQSLMDRVYAVSKDWDNDVASGPSLYRSICWLNGWFDCTIWEGSPMEKNFMRGDGAVGQEPMGAEERR